MHIIGAGTTGSKPQNDDVVRETNLESFARDVLYASQEVPVLVDFWAPWCGPCKQLTPILEKVVRAARGRVRLVKVNVDENPELAQQFRIQSIPTVYAFLAGQPVAGFAGAQPESQVRALVERLIGGPLAADVEEELKRGQQALAEGRADRALEAFSRVLEVEPERGEAYGGLVRALLALGRTEEARRRLDQAPQAVASHPAVSGARAALEIAREAGELPPVEELERRITADGDDFEARYHLATRLFLLGRFEEAFDQLLHIVRRDRSWREDGARKRLLAFFEALGPTHPATLQGRRKLSSLLFA